MNQRLDQTQFEQLRDEYLDGQLSAEAHEAFTQYLNENPQAAAQLQDEQQYLDALKTDRFTHINETEESFVTGVLSAWQTEVTPVSNFKLHDYLRPALVAAAVLTITALVWVFSNPGTTTPNNMPAPIIATKPGPATTPISVLLRETHQQYNSKSKQVTESIAQPTSILSLGRLFEALAPTEEDATPSNKEQG